jgi:hypothetical protein
MKRTLEISQIYLDISVSLFVGLFVYAASSKLLEFEEFTIQLSRSPMLTSMAGFYSWFVPGIELIIAGMMIFHRTRGVGLYGFYAMMAIFTFYIIAITQFSYFIPCSCGGVLASLGWREHLYFNIVFVILAAAAVCLQGEQKYSNKTELGVAENLEQSRH